MPPLIERNHMCVVHVQALYITVLCMQVLWGEDVCTKDESSGDKMHVQRPIEWTNPSFVGRINYK